MNADQLQMTVEHRLETAAGQQFVKLGPELQEKWKAQIDPMVDAWANTDDAHRKVIATVRELAAHYSDVR